MAKHLNPLEKEFLIRKFKGNSKVKLGDFCRANNVSETSFKKWLKQYEEADHGEDDTGHISLLCSDTSGQNHQS